MSNAAVLKLPAPDRAADVELIAHYLGDDLPLEVVDAVENLLEQNAEFRANVLPLIALWRMPVRFDEVFREGFENETPRQFQRRVRRYLRERDSVKARQAEWDRVFKDVGLEPVRLDVIMGRRTRPRWRRVVGVFATLMLLAVAGLGYATYARVRVWQTGVGDAQAGRAVTPGAALFKPTVYEANGTEVLEVALPNVALTLRPGSRLMQGTSAGVGAIDGEAAIAVAPKKVWGLMAADVPFMLFTGRYRVSHPVGGATRIVIDSGRVLPNFSDLQTFRSGPRYHTGSVLTAEAKDSLTIISIVGPDGNALPAQTVKNHAIRAILPAAVRPEQGGR